VTVSANELVKSGIYRVGDAVARVLTDSRESADLV